MNVDKSEDRYHPLLKINGVSSNYLSHLNPWIPLWWSAAFPGFGHFLIGNSITAYILMLFEFTVNNFAHINHGIYYCMIGDISHAIEVINLRWFPGYIGVYVFAMYDCYRRTVELNKVYLLSYRYTKKNAFSSLTPLSVNNTDLTSPVLGMVWSFITPGLGAQFMSRLPTFVFSLIWWGITIYYSRWFEGIYYSAIGDIQKAKSIIDPQWFLFIPSLIGFAMYYSYCETVKANKHFKLSQAQYLRSQYQQETFEMPFEEEKSPECT
jgi:hypothetical protein